MIYSISFRISQIVSLSQCPRIKSAQKLQESDKHADKCEQTVEIFGCIYCSQATSVNTTGLVATTKLLRDWFTRSEVPWNVLSHHKLPENPCTAKPEVL